MPKENAFNSSGLKAFYMLEGGGLPLDNFGDHVAYDNHVYATAP